VFEPVGFLTDNFPELSRCIAATLLKIKLCLELTAVDDSEAIGEGVPQEILDAIQTHIPQSNAVVGRLER